MQASIPTIKDKLSPAITISCNVMPEEGAYPKRGDYIHGFTLPEMIITLSIIGIIITLSAPAMYQQLANMEAHRIKGQLATALSAARAESFIRRQNVLLCLSNDVSRCHRDSDQHLLLFVDVNGNKHYDKQTDQLLAEQHLNPKYSKLSLRVGARRHYTKFWGDSGKPRGHFGHIKYCPTSTYNRTMYQVSFNQAGMITHKPNSRHPTGC